MSKARAARLRLPLALIAVLAVAFLAAQGASAAADPIEWPMHRGGPEHAGNAGGEFVGPDPLDLLGEAALGAYVHSSPLAVDLDGDGDAEVVVATDFDKTSTTKEMRVVAYEYDGGLSQIWSVPAPWGFTDPPTDGTLRIGAADMTGDGIPEIFAAGNFLQDTGVVSLNYDVQFIVDAAGSILWTGANAIGSTSYPVLGDLDGDGRAEAVFAYQTGGTAAEQFVAMVNYTGGVFAQVWSESLGAPGALVDLAIAEVDATHAGMELIVGHHTSSTSGWIETCRPVGTAANCSRGPQTGSGIIGVSVGDPDGDGTMEVVATARSTGGINTLMVLEPDAGTNSFVRQAGVKDGYIWNTPALADIDGDGNQDIVALQTQDFIDIVDFSGDLVAYSYDGTAFTSLGRIDRASPPDKRSWGGGVFGNILGDEKPEMVFPSVDVGFHVVQFDAAGVPSEVAVFDVDQPARAPAAMADINGDCAVDLIMAWGNGTLRAYGDATPRYKPGAPTNFQGTENGTAATLTWDAPASDGGRPITHYSILRGARGGTLAEVATVPAGTTTYTDATGPPFAAQVDYRVVAVNCMGDSPATPKLELDVHEPPEEIVNTGHAIVPGTQFKLTEAMLSYEDDLSADNQVTFEVTSMPTQGKLLFGAVNPAPMGTPATFSMQDIIDGKVHYQHQQTTVVDDSFTFTVKDHLGKSAEAATFTILVDQITELTLTRNVAASLLVGTTLGIDEAYLEAKDPTYGSSEIVFNITALPTLGTLKVDGVALALHDTFTMAQVDGGALFYVSGTVTGDDSFDFEVTSPGDSLNGTFSITVEPLVPVKAAIGLPQGPHLVGKTYTFTDASVAGTYPIVARAWLLPDGTTTDAAHLAVKFTEAGIYTYRLTVYASDGSNSTVERKVIVEDYVAPQARFFSDRSVAVVGQKITFWDRTQPGNTRIVLSEWDFKDAVHGTVDLTDEPVIAHAFTKPGHYLVTLRVQDEMDTVSTDSHLIKVDPKPVPGSAPPPMPEPQSTKPVADAGPDIVAVAGTVVRLDGKASSPVGRPLTIEWTHLTGTVLDLRGADTARPVFAVPHLLEGNTESVLELAVGDGVSTSRDIVRIVLRNEGDPGPGAIAAPTAVFTYEVGTGGQVRFRSLDAGLPDPIYEWDFGDGHTSSKPIPDHIYSDPGTYSVRLTLRDAVGREATFSQGLTLQVTQVDVPQEETSEGGSAWPVLLAVGGGVLVVGVVALGLWVWLSRAPGHKR